MVCVDPAVTSNEEYDRSTSQGDEGTGFNKSRGGDFIVKYYSKIQNNLREKQVDETAELVIEKLKKEKKVL
ncbi:hypothetical protein [Methanolobus sp. WCC4]|uniref:hypothetical protein n=1 Tax=Methanolobus sp. WCC4 TaxID=3125784 RepID=UPI0030F71FA0